MVLTIEEVEKAGEQANLQKGSKDRKDKKVTFADKVNVIGSSISENTIFFNGKSYSQNKARVSASNCLILVKKKDTEALANYLKIFTSATLNDFFCSEKGQTVIMCLLSQADNSIFRFILNHTPEGCLQKALRQNGYAKLVRFLESHKITESYQADSDQIRDIRVEKFKMLLEIDENIDKFIIGNQNNNKDFITNKIMEDFNKAKVSRCKFTLT
jgi:hypothetical protein